jgi:transposase
MCRPQKDPLRPLSQEERKTLEQYSRSLTIPADQVIHAKEVLAVADGHTFTDAAKLAGRKSGDAVAHLISRFNREGLSALSTRHGGGPPFRYTVVECERILREFRRAPDRRLDGTATWSLVTLQRALRRAPDGLPRVSTHTILCVLHEAGYTWQEDRTWCKTGTALRVRKSGTVEVTDPDACAKKNSSRRRTRELSKRGSLSGRKMKPDLTRPSPTLGITGNRRGNQPGILMNMPETGLLNCLRCSTRQREKCASKASPPVPMPSCMSGFNRNWPRFLLCYLHHQS